ncbi:MULTISPECIES: HAMP domain-containing sensor histidine kinase [unclassified Mesorhizobium]|uniref:sensor histidine kinase n=1 Tax=unclassified Mesorhizobium TaxID=325217 RepID=UPI00333D9012
MAVLYVTATVIIVGVLVYRAYDTAGTLNDRELTLRAADLAQSISIDAGGSPRLNLPSKLRSAYQAASGADIYAIRGPENRIIAASPPSFGALVEGWPAATDDPDYFRLEHFGSGSDDYYGLSIRLDSVSGPLSISVARAADADALIRSVLRDFVLDIAWVIPLLVVITLAIGILAIRSVLKPVREVSEMAAAIGPNATGVRLSDEHLPTEIAPLVTAVNRALDRLDQGFAVQRQFTANAAHELRTPLAIITAALDTMEDVGELTKFKADVARMNRLVEQLLSVARLDAIELDTSATVNLNDVAARVVENMAPWVLANDRTIAFNGYVEPVQVKGNAHAIGDAIRNLVENAVHYTAPKTEVTVSTYPDGSVSIADQGPGILAEDRERVFRRFWRGSGAGSQGAGLGLAIVAEIMNAHGGGAIVDDNPNGGATFTLCFVSADPDNSSGANGQTDLLHL